MPLLALLASLVWGASDFVAGTLSRRLHPVAVTGAAHTVGFVGVLVWALLDGGFADPGAWLLPSLAAGVFGFLGLAALYAALARGRMGVVAPIGATGAVVPVLYDLVRGQVPPALQVVGLVAAIAGCVLASGPELRAPAGAQRTSAGVIGLAVFAAVGLGVVLLVLASTGEEHPAQVLTGMRATSVVLAVGIALAARSVGGLRRPDAAGVGADRVGDTHANPHVAIAASGGSVAVTSVLASLFPVVTVLLARVFHDERLGRVQLVGVGTALAGVALIAGG